MWSCIGNRKRLNAYIDGELPERARRSVQRHLRRCASCRRFLDDRHGLAPLLEKYDPPPAPAGLSSRILAQAATRQKRKGTENTPDFRWRAFVFQPWLVRGVTSAALVVGLTMGAWMGWASLRRASPGQWTGPIDDGAAGMPYAFDTLSAEPRGSIQAAMLALLGGGK